jgi:hypothetical protein
MIPQIHGILNMGAVPPPDPVIDHVDPVYNGVYNNPLALSFQVTNSGGEGNVYGGWHLYDSYDVEIDSGSEEFLMPSGEYDYLFHGLLYPAAGTGYYFTVELYGYGSPVQSNSFDVT